MAGLASRNIVLNILCCVNLAVGLDLVITVLINKAFVIYGLCPVLA